MDYIDNCANLKLTPEQHKQMELYNKNTKEILHRLLIQEIELRTIINRYKKIILLQQIIMVIIIIILWK